MIRLIPLSVKFFCGLAVLGLAADVVPGTGPVDAVGRLTLDGVLVAGVIALWKALTAKDAQLVGMTSKVTEVMTLVLEAVKEQRVSNNETRAAVDDLREELARMGIGASGNPAQRARGERGVA